MTASNSVVLIEPIDSNYALAENPSFETGVLTPWFTSDPGIYEQGTVVTDATAPHGSKVGQIEVLSLGTELVLPGTAGNYASTPDSPALSLAGQNVLRLPGVAGNYVSTPDSAAVSITGDIDIRAKIAPNSWLPSANQVILAKENGDPQRAFRLSLLTNGTLALTWFPTGSLASQLSVANNNGSVVTQIGVVGGQALWVRVTLDADNGASGNTLRFYTSSDGVIWAQLGTDRITAGVTSFVDTTQFVEIGSRNSGNSDPFAGIIHYAEVRNGIDGPVVVKFDPSTISPTVDQLPTTLVSSTGETWTINGTKWNWRRDNEVRSLRLPGTSGSYGSTPDSAALSLQGTATALRLSGHSFSSYVATPDNAAMSITGDIDIRAEITPDNWAMGRAQIIIASDVGDPNRRFRFTINSTGAIVFEWFPLGTVASTITKGSTVPTGFAPGVKRWIRVTLDVDNGAAGNDVKFYTSTDGTSWAQLGATITTAGVTSIPDTAGQFEIGSRFNGTPADLFVGLIHRVQVRNGIDGTIVADPNFNASPWVIGDTGTTARSSGGQTWTLLGNAEIAAEAERRSLRLSGAAGVNASTPDSPALSVSGSIDMRVKVALDDWTPASAQILVSKSTTANLSYQMHVDSAGKLIFALSSNGTSYDLVNVQSSSPLGFADGSTWWLRCYYAASTGFWAMQTSTDGVTWATITSGTGVVGAIFNSAFPLWIGANFSGSSNMLIGNVFAVDIRNNINNDGTGIVANPDFTRQPWDVGETGGATGADAAGNTWTLNGAAVIQRAFASDLDVRVRVALDDWTPASTNTFASKRDHATVNKSWRWYVASAGAMAISLSANGVFEPSDVGSAVTGFTDGSMHWVRFTWRASDGRVQFFTSDDGVSWAQSGSDSTLALWGIYDSTVPVEIGARAGGTLERLTGNVLYAEIRNGIDGTVVANPDFQNQPWDVGETGGATGTDAAGNTWTLFGVAIVQRAFVSDLDIRVKVALDDWTPTSTGLAAKWGSSGLSYYFIVDSSGNLRLGLSPSSSGAGVFASASSVATGFADGSIHWVRATWRQSDGRVQYFTSSDGAIWTQLGSNRSIVIAGIYDNAASVVIGGNGFGTEILAGSVYSAEVRSGIDGPLVAKFAPENVLVTGIRLPASVIDPETGVVWTINGTTWDWVSNIDDNNFTLFGGRDTTNSGPLTGTILAKGPAGRRIKFRMTRAAAAGGGSPYSGLAGQDEADIQTATGDWQLFTVQLEPFSDGLTGSLIWRIGLAHLESGVPAVAGDLVEVDSFRVDTGVGSYPDGYGDELAAANPFGYRKPSRGHNEVRVFDVV